MSWLLAEADAVGDSFDDALLRISMVAREQSSYTVYEQIKIRWSSWKNPILPHLSLHHGHHYRHHVKKPRLP